MQSLHKKNKVTFSKCWIPTLKIEENRKEFLREKQQE